MKFGMTVAACVALAAMGVTLGGCTSTRGAADLSYQAPQGPYRLVVLKPDVSVGLLTAGGVMEPRQDWTESAERNILAALREG